MIKITEKEMCCGCEACYNICPAECIDLVMDEEGFRYPQIDEETCIDCGKCQKVCPALNRRKEKNELQKGYAAWNKNKWGRLQSSSGGIFPLLAENIIKSGGIVVGVRMGEGCRRAEHVLVRDINALKQINGSKYLQSNIRNTYREIKVQLERGKCVLFSGVPCQIAGLKNYLGKAYDNLICVDVICHGVPSPGLWEKNVDYLERKHNRKLEDVNFRSKQYGGHTSSGIAYIGHKQNKYYYAKEEDFFMQMFLKNLSLRPSCYECSYKGMNRNSDITLGDFWGVEDFFEGLNDGYGVSIVVLHSMAGQKLFEQIFSEILYQEVNVEKVFQHHNREMTESASRPENREEFFENYNQLIFEDLGKSYVHISLRTRIKKVLREFGILKVIRCVRGGGMSNNNFGIEYRLSTKNK